MPRRRKAPVQNGVNDALDETLNRQPRDEYAEDRALRAYRYWVLGYTYSEIAAKCGYNNHVAALRAVKKHRQTIPQRDNRALVAQQADRLEYAIHTVLDAVESYLPKDKLWAIDRLTPLLKRQAELLGLDASKEAIEAAKTVIREIPHGLIPLPAPRVVDAERAS